MDALSSDKLFYQYIKKSDMVILPGNNKSVEKYGVDFESSHNKESKFERIYSLDEVGKNSKKKSGEVKENRLQIIETLNKELFLDAIRATYNKYDIYQVRGAILKIIEENNYESITSGTDKEMFRDKLRKTVSSKEIYKYIKSTVDIIDNGSSNHFVLTKEELVDRFLSFVLVNEIVDNFRKSCMVTCEKYGVYGKEQLIFAINKKLRNHDSGGFSRFPKNGDTSINYRKTIDGYSPQNIKESMILLLGYHGIDKTSSSDDDIIDAYATLIEDLSQIKPMFR